MARSKKKLPFIDGKLLAKVSKNKISQSFMPIKTWSRRSTIIEGMIGMTFQVHNGKTFINVKVDPSRVGHKLGEFAPTRKFGGHPEKKKDDQKKGGK